MIDRFFSSNLFVPCVVAATSLLAIEAFRRKGKLAAAGLSPALNSTLQAMGLASIFYIVNLLAGFLVIDVLRLVSRSFISHYFIVDGTLPYLSLMQGLTVRNWIGTARR